MDGPYYQQITRTRKEAENFLARFAQPAHDVQPMDLSPDPANLSNEELWNENELLRRKIQELRQLISNSANPAANGGLYSGAGYPGGNGAHLQPVQHHGHMGGPQSHNFDNQE